VIFQPITVPAKKQLLQCNKATGVNLDL